MDRLKNFIVVDAEERRMFAAAGGEPHEHMRSLGQVMVPGKHLVKVEVAESIWSGEEAVAAADDDAQTATAEAEGELDTQPDT